MKKHGLLYALSAMLTLLPAKGVFSALNPTPDRESLLLFSFEDPKFDGWVSDPGATGDNTAASQNTNAQYVSDGSASLKLDWTGVNGWVEPIMAVDLAAPIDLSDYHAISVDVYAPAEALSPDNSGGWFQIDPRLVSANGTQYLGNRDIHSGWNHLTWDLQDGLTKDISRIYFAENSDNGTPRPWTAPIYLDNFRAWKDPLPGIHSDEVMINAFDTAADAKLFPMTDSVPVAINANKDYLHDGAGSLSVDLSGLSGWHAPVAQTLSLPSIDATKATAIHVDVFVPTGNQPSDWSQIGFEIQGEGGQLATATLGYITNQWNTLELPLSTDDAAKLKNVTEFAIRLNSGAEWNGPIYLDNLRMVVPAATSTVKLGDLNADGKVNVQDATLSLRVAVGLLTPTADQTTADDVNKDGKTNIQDTTLILQVAVGTKSGF